MKFQVWDKKNKRMSNVGRFEIANKRDLVASIKNGGHRVHLCDLVFRLSTDLCDKEGHEAFQYDLIIHEARNSGQPIEIVWNNGSWHGCYGINDFIFVLNAREMEQSVIIGNTLDDWKRKK